MWELLSLLNESSVSLIYDMNVSPEYQLQYNHERTKENVWNFCKYSLKHVYIYIYFRIEKKNKKRRKF